MSLSRREFIRISVGGVIVTVGLRSTAADALGDAGLTTGGPPTLVLVTLYGGNDALNTVIPVGDPRYASQRGGLAIDPDATHDLGDGFAFHPAMTSCKSLWDRGRFAVVHGVGFPALDRSHFHCMDVWQAASEADHTTGWIGRWLDASGADPLAALSVGSTVPLAMRGARRSSAVVPAEGGLTPPGDARLREGVTTMMAASTERSPLGSLVASSTLDLFDVVDQVGPTLDSLDVDDAADEPTHNGARAAESALSAQLGVVAALIEAEMPTRVYGVDLGGFDTHANQLGTHEQLLTELDGALGGFVERMGSRPVTVLVHSEFGRRVVPNGSGGTDHGSAGSVLLAGRVRPGFHGEPSPLDRLDDGDLATTTDFRAVYGGLLDAVLGIDPADIIADAPTPLAVV